VNNYDFDMTAFNVNVHRYGSVVYQLIVYVCIIHTRAVSPPINSVCLFAVCVHFTQSVSVLYYLLKPILTAATLPLRHRGACMHACTRILHISPGADDILHVSMLKVRVPYLF
jgi:hypothetical protein